MGVSKNRGTPKWMVYFMENPIKFHDLGVPLFWETPIIQFIPFFVLFPYFFFRNHPRLLGGGDDPPQKKYRVL